VVKTQTSSRNNVLVLKIGGSRAELEMVSELKALRRQKFAQCAGDMPVNGRWRRHVVGDLPADKEVWITEGGHGCFYDDLDYGKASHTSLGLRLILVPL